jgi:hypothetical protein
MRAHAAAAIRFFLANSQSSAEGLRPEAASDCRRRSMTRGNARGGRRCGADQLGLQEEDRKDPLGLALIGNQRSEKRIGAELGELGGGRLEGAADAKAIDNAL